MKTNLIRKAVTLFAAGILSAFALGACASPVNTANESSAATQASSASEPAAEQTNTNLVPHAYTEEDAAKAKQLLASAEQQRQDAAARAEEERLKAEEERLAAEAAAEAEAAAAAEAERAAAEEFEGEVYYEEPVEYYDGGGQTQDSCIPGGVAFR